MSAHFPTFAKGMPSGRICRLAGNSPLCLLTIIWGAFLSGCSMYRSGFNNLIVAPSQFQIHHDRRATERFHQQIAREALAEQQAAHPGQRFSVDYAAGFEYGVIEYLTNGGVTGPPLLPPRPYWKLASRSGTDNEAAQQWLLGATDGRERAIASGLRTVANVPSSIPMGSTEREILRPRELEALPPPITRGTPPENASDQTGRVSLK
ncbi:MAG: hypothetical protein JWM11_3247 [Planctomycetaceae bacterium]|nr:hypothetical protein [Planctomycetaceae bacterium]